MDFSFSSEKNCLVNAAGIKKNLLAAMLFPESHFIFHNTHRYAQSRNKKTMNCCTVSKEETVLTVLQSHKLFQSDHAVSYHRKWNHQVPPIFSPH